MTSTEARLLRLEQRLARAEDVNRRQAGRIAALEQAQRNSPTGPYSGGGGGTGGGLYTASGPSIVAGGSAEMTVTKVSTEGNAELGTRTVVNPHPDDTTADLTLYLVPLGDGGFGVLVEDCPPEA